MDKIIVLSLFDGISSGHIALERAGIRVDKYYASEIDKYAIKITQANYPETIQLGDIQNWREWNIPHVDMILAGSPCQGFSVAGKGLNFDDPRSKLFFTFLDVLKHYQAINPNLIWLLENVKMKKEWRDKISGIVGVDPILINSALVSAQYRKRLYWTNISGVQQPGDKNIVLKNILDSGVVDADKSYCIDSSYFKGGNLVQYFDKGRRQLIFEARNGKAVTINAEDIITPRSFYETRTELGKKHRREIRLLKGIDSTPRSKFHKHYVAHTHEKANCIVTVDSFLNYIIDNDYYCRKLTPLECERLQTIPDNYTNYVSNTQRYKALGNGWTVDVIAHILSYIKTPSPQTH